MGRSDTDNDRGIGLSGFVEFRLRIMQVFYASYLLVRQMRFMRKTRAGMCVLEKILIQSDLKRTIFAGYIGPIQVGDAEARPELGSAKAKSAPLLSMNPC